MSMFQEGNLPNAYKSEHPLLTQENLKEIYKQRISEYMYTKKDDLNCMERYARQVNVDSSTKCLSAMINYIWGSYVYHMGQTNYWWKTGPPPPLVAPVWLEEHLKPILSSWIDAALSSSG